MYESQQKGDYDNKTITVYYKKVITWGDIGEIGNVLMNISIANIYWQKCNQYTLYINIKVIFVLIF
jgi:hypothetical protein